jgi:hypothetical protein
MAIAAVRPRKKTRITKKQADAQMTALMDKVVGVVEGSRARMSDEEKEKADQGALAIARERRTKAR